MPTPDSTPLPLPLASEIENFLQHVLVVQRMAAEVNSAHRTAIARADLLTVSKCVVSQELVARELLRLEEQRDRLLVSLGVPLRARANISLGGEPISLRTYVQRCPEPKRARLVQLLDETGNLVRGNAGMVKSIELASRSLLTHINALMSQIKRAMTQTGVYSPGRGQGGDGAFSPALAAVAMDISG